MFMIALAVSSALKDIADSLSGSQKVIRQDSRGNIAIIATTSEPNVIAHTTNSRWREIDCRNIFWRQNLYSKLARLCYNNVFPY